MLYTTITPRGRDISAYNNSIEYLRIYRHNSYKFLKKAALLPLKAVYLIVQTTPGVLPHRVLTLPGENSFLLK
jgi:hypothetical protein